jgi:hypothetical protein
LRKVDSVVEDRDAIAANAGSVVEDRDSIAVIAA